jgi:hypothetical protein
MKFGPVQESIIVALLFSNKKRYYSQLFQIKIISSFVFLNQRIRPFITIIYPNIK